MHYLVYPATTVFWQGSTRDDGSRAGSAASALPPLSRTNLTCWTMPKGLKASVSMSTCDASMKDCRCLRHRCTHYVWKHDQAIPRLPSRRQRRASQDLPYSPLAVADRSLNYPSAMMAIVANMPRTEVTTVGTHGELPL